MTVANGKKKEDIAALYASGLSDLIAS